MIRRHRCPVMTSSLAFCGGVLWLTTAGVTVESANILAVQSVPGHSHWSVMSAVLRALTDAGHAVTVFTPFRDADDGRENYTVVGVAGAMRPSLALDVAYLTEHFGSASTVMPNMANATRRFCAEVYGHSRMRDILWPRRRRRRPPFDAFVTEPFSSECVSYAARRLRVPLIYVVPPPALTHLERPLFGHVPNPAAVAHVMSPTGRAPRTFARRFANAALTVYCAALTWYAERTLKRADPHPYDRADPVKPSVTFVNTHFVTEPSRPLPPNVVQIGGIHLSRPKSIPQDILEFIEDSPHGVIYFTFGSVVSITSLPENIQKAFKEAFAQVPQKVLWKYEGEMKDKPKNVMTRKWFPQRDILLHPKVKLFISHGGISGVYEAMDAGVPVLGFPIYFDQPRNIDNLVGAGMAISMDVLSVTKNTILNAILELVNNKKYQINAKITSEQFKDRPTSPAELVVYWTEYVLRHKETPNLKSYALNLTWYQYFLVDAIATFLSIVSVIIFVVYISLKTVSKIHPFKYNNQNFTAKHE